MRIPLEGLPAVAMPEPAEAAPSSTKSAADEAVLEVAANGDERTQDAGLVEEVASEGLAGAAVVAAPE